MLQRLIVFGMCAALLIGLAACSFTGQPAGPDPDPSETPPAENGYPGPSYPGPVDPGEIDPGYPMPTEPGGAPGQAVSLFPPEAADAQRARGPFLVENATLTPTSNQAGAYDLAVEGTLPTPCNLLRVVVSPPDEQKRIVVEAYSVMDQDKACIERIEPFAGIIATLSGFPSGTYSVVLNDTQVGEVTFP